MPRVLVTALLSIGLLAGCTTRNDPSYNAYAPGGGDRTVLETAELVAETLEGFVEDLDARLENGVY